MLHQQEEGRVSIPHCADGSAACHIMQTTMGRDCGREGALRCTSVADVVHP